MSNILSQSVRIGAAVALLTSSVPALHVFAASATPGPITAVNAPPPGTLTPVNKSTPELDAFRKAWEGVNNYTDVITAHETTNDGKETQDRTYDYKFVKPNAALISITAGPGKGGGAAWHGGPKVKGHQGGAIAHLKLIVPKNDPRATSLRGDQIEVASFGFELDQLSTVPGTLTEAKTADGVAITLVPTATESTGVTKEVITLNPTTHLPVKREQFIGDKSVKTEVFTNVQVNVPNLTVKDIDII